MTEDSTPGISRRDAIKTVAATTALAAMAAPYAHATGSDVMQIALVGCGGRGTDAAKNALSTKAGPVKIVAMADVFQERLDQKAKSIGNQFKDQFEVTKERMFLGFDGYKKAMDTLKKGDVVILTTPPAFRWVQFQYAIEKGLNVFMEKPVTVDGPSTVRMLKLAEASEKAGLKVGVGLMCRHCDARGEQYKKIKEGLIGDLVLLRAYRMAGPTGSAFVNARKPDDPMSELLYQIRNFHGFLWASGGAYSDFLIHNIDECCWMKDAWPTEAKASGARHFRGNYVDQNFDTYSTEFTFPDGAKMYLEGRTMPGCKQEFASYCHGTKGCGIISQSGHAPSHARLFKGQKFVESNVIWRFDKEEPSPYQLEWDHLMEAIRKDKPHNEVRRGAEASLVTVMGRMAAHTGQVVTREMALNNKQDLGGDLTGLTLMADSPLKADKNGKYPVPMPGVYKDGREF